MNKFVQVLEFRVFVWFTNAICWIKIFILVDQFKILGKK